MYPFDIFKNLFLHKIEPNLHIYIVCSLTRSYFMTWLLCVRHIDWYNTVFICSLDSEPPSFEKCIGYQIGYTDRGSESGKIRTFQFPVVKDNIDKNIQPQLMSKTNLKQALKIGVYDLRYSAKDTAGNNAVGCKIKLVIKSMYTTEY